MLRTRPKQQRLTYSGLIPLSMIKLQPYQNGLYTASKEVKEEISETLRKRNLQEIKGYVKKRKKHLTYVSMDIFKGLTNNTIVCYFAEE